MHLPARPCSGHRVHRPAWDQQHSMGETMTTRSRKLPVAMAAMFVLAACGGGASSPRPRPPRRPASATRAASAAPPAAGAAAVTLELAHSYQDAQPQVACGAKIIADEVAAANVGLTIELFGAGPARLRRRSDPVGRRRRHRHGHPGSVRAERHLRADRRRRRRVRVRRQRAHVPLLLGAGVGRAQAGLLRRDRRAGSSAAGTPAPASSRPTSRSAPRRPRRASRCGSRRPRSS